MAQHHINMEGQKVFAAILTAGVIGMLTWFVAGQLVHPSLPHENVYQIDEELLAAVGGGGHAAEETVDPGPEPIVHLLADADVAAGEGLTRACTTCHVFQADGPHRTGPRLWNVVGAHVGHWDDFSYSDAISGHGGNWTYENLNAFLYNPQYFAEGTRMAYRGVPGTQDRANLIAYLRTLSDDPQPLPSQEEIDAVLAEHAAAAEGEHGEEGEEGEGTAEDEAHGESGDAAEGEGEHEAEGEGAAHE